MKLVELLAKEFSKWPERASCIVQGSEGEICTCSDGFPDPHNGDWTICGPISAGSSVDWLDTGSNKKDIASDQASAIVTPELWQAERDRQKGSGSHRFKQGDSVKVIASSETEWCRVGDIHKIRVCKTCPDGELVYVVNDDHESCWIRECNLELVARSSDKSGEWKRNRGGKQPVADGTPIEVRYREGETKECFAGDNWSKHWSRSNGERDIMAYRVIGQPQTEEPKVNVFVGKDVNIEYAFSQDGVALENLDWKPLGNAVMEDVEFDSVKAEEVEVKDIYSVDITDNFKVDQIDGPIKWRDRIVELEAHEEDIQREIASLHARLTEEGFSLIRQYPSVKQTEPTIYMSDWRNWKAGDIVTSLVNYGNQFSIGSEYEIERIENETLEMVADDEGDQNGWGVDNFKFVRRP